MNHSELVEKYLTRVILFKEKQALYSDFCDETKRENLLKELSEDLGFGADMWEYRRECAARVFRIYKALNADYKLGNTEPKKYAALLKKYIYKAIALDPFQEEYYKEYFHGDVGRNKANKILALQYIRLFHPNSAEFQNLLVDLNIRSNEVSFDYLSESVITPFISEMVLLQEKSEVLKSSGEESQQLQNLAKQAGLDAKSLEAIEEDVKQMIRTVQDAMNTYSPDWIAVNKAALAMEKALDLAPYDKNVLLTGIIFYGGFYWRAILGYKEIKAIEGKTELMQYLFQVKKPKREQLFWKAAELFKKSLAIKERWVAVSLKEAMAEGNTSKSDYERMVEQFGMDDFSFRHNQIARFDKNNIVETIAYLDKEIIAFKLLSAHFRSKKHDLSMAIVSGILTAVACFFFSVWLFDSLVPFFPFFIPSLLVPMAVLYVREKVHQRSKIEIDEIPDMDSLSY